LQHCFTADDLHFQVFMNQTTKEYKQDSLNLVGKPFWADLPYTDIFQWLQRVQKSMSIAHFLFLHMMEAQKLGAPCQHQCQRTWGCSFPLKHVPKLT
jgi:hypothetical protein